MARAKALRIGKIMEDAGTSLEQRPSVAVISMQKDESELLPVWLAYYGRLVGPENIYLIDNGSDSDDVKSIIENAKKSNTTCLAYPGGENFDKKGEIVQGITRSLLNNYDVVIPIDGDEFLTFASNPQELINIVDFYEEVSRFTKSEFDVGFISLHFLNIAGTPNVASRAFKKVFVRPNSKFKLNRGFHYEDKHKDIGYRSKFAYIHFHHKRTVEEMRKLAIPKLGEERYNDLMALETVERQSGKGKHMARYLKLKQPGYDRYMERLEGERFDVSEVFSALKFPVPYA